MKKKRFKKFLVKFHLISKVYINIWKLVRRTFVKKKLTRKKKLENISEWVFFLKNQNTQNYDKECFKAFN